MPLVEVVVCVLVLYGQRMMLDRPGHSNFAWLAANVALAAIAWSNGNWGLVLMYSVLGVSNVDLLRTIHRNRAATVAGEAP